MSSRDNTFKAIRCCIPATGMRKSGRISRISRRAYNFRLDPRRSKEEIYHRRIKPGSPLESDGCQPADGRLFDDRIDFVVVASKVADYRFCFEI